MFDFRKSKIIDLNTCKRLGEDSNAYLFSEPSTGKKYVLKFYEEALPKDEVYLINEFKKLALLSAEPEIGTVYGLVTIKNGNATHTGYLMDYISGKSLQSFLDSNTIEYSHYIDILQQLALALEKSHHYEVAHNDLNLENIMIDDFGNVKLIDFFYDTSYSSATIMVENDIKYFLCIEQILFNRINESSKNRAKIISQACNSIATLRGLSKKILVLNDISFDLSLVDEAAIKFISQICYDDFNDIKMSECVAELNMIIPDNLSTEITPLEIGYINDNNSGTRRLKYRDTRIERIELNIKNHFNNVFHQLEMIQLANFEIRVKAAEPFIGPYTFDIYIYVKPKLIKLKMENQNYNFLPTPSIDTLGNYLTKGIFNKEKI